MLYKKWFLLIPPRARLTRMGPSLRASFRWQDGPYDIDSRFLFPFVIAIIVVLIALVPICLTAQEQPQRLYRTL